MPDSCGVADRGRGAGLGHADHQVGVDRAARGPAGGRSRRGSRAPTGRRSCCPAGPGRRTRRRSPWASGWRTGCERTPSASMASSSPGSMSRTNEAPTMSSAAVSEATTQPRSSRPSDQRPHAVRVAGRVQGVLVHEHQAERAAHRRQQLQRGLLQRWSRRHRGPAARRGCRSRWSPRRAALAISPASRARRGQLGGVDQVAVVAERDAGAGRGVAEHRLGVLPGGGAGGRVAAVADGDVARAWRPASARRRPG